MALKDTVKQALRVFSDAMDLEIDALIAAAKRDMERIGVSGPMLDDKSMDPLIEVAVILYCKAAFGYDNSEASRFQSSYRQIVKDILNSPTSYRSDQDEME